MTGNGVVSFTQPRVNANSASEKRTRSAALQFQRFKADPPLGCQHPSSPNKAHLISFLQANVFDVFGASGKKKKKEGKKSGVFF